jgi:secondary thiamine-phosphate synthase enzyme
MNWHKKTLEIRTRGKGLYPFTEAVSSLLRQWSISDGMCYLYVQHTSASLVISESYDPTAKMDLETYMERAVPEGETWYRHTIEGADDSTSHIRSMLTSTCLTIPIDSGNLSLGTWQGIYLFEHRKRGHTRKILLRCLEIAT